MEANIWVKSGKFKNKLLRLLGWDQKTSYICREGNKVSKNTKQLFMKKYKLVNGTGWESSFKEGYIYNGSTKNEYGMCVEMLATEGKFTEDWEEVVEIPKKYKFLGDLEVADDGSYGGLIVGDIYNFTDRCPYSYGCREEYDFVKFYIEMYPNDWELVTDKLVNTIFTDAEVVTLITFLNDNFEGFWRFIGDDTSWTLSHENYDLLEGDLTNHKANLLIEKLEKNDTPLTEAEKVTIITFLNDNFEGLQYFIEDAIDGLGDVYYINLDGCGEEASLLIDKIEKS